MARPAPVGAVHQAGVRLVPVESVVTAWPLEVTQGPFSPCPAGIRVQAADFSWGSPAHPRASSAQRQGRAGVCSRGGIHLGRCQFQPAAPGSRGAQFKGNGCPRCHPALDGAAAGSCLMVLGEGGSPGESGWGDAGLWFLTQHVGLPVSPRPPALWPQSCVPRLAQRERGFLTKRFTRF